MSELLAFRTRSWQWPEFKGARGPDLDSSSTHSRARTVSFLFASFMPGRDFGLLPHLCFFFLFLWSLSWHWKGDFFFLLPFRSWTLFVLCWKGMTFFVLFLSVKRETGLWSLKKVTISFWRTNLRTTTFGIWS